MSGNELREKYIKSLEQFMVKISVKMNTLPDFTDPENGNGHIFRKIDFLQSQPKHETVEQWVSVKDRLPKNMGRYSVYGNCTNDGDMEDIAHFITSVGNSGYFEKSNQPTHWKSLSEKPEATP